MTVYRCKLCGNLIVAGNSVISEELVEHLMTEHEAEYESWEDSGADVPILYAEYYNFVTEN